jgi:ABC-type phosphate/phosphonate transport system substrate-binding protein
MRIQPSQRRRSDSKAFPGRSDWKSSSDNAADQSTVEQSSASTAENVSSEIVPATLPDDSLTRSPGLKTPRPFPEQEIENTVKAPVPPVEVSSELAVSQSWRNENLDTAGTGRMPLLVAPLPPQEPAVASLVETTDDTLAVETDSVPRPASDSRVWLLLAAAAGAFGMLFVRRRPARY